MEKGKAIACFGEVMLRLGAAGKLRLAQSLPGTLEATFGGGEANVCASLAMLGKESRYLTALPDNPLSRAFAAQLRGIGADVEHVLYTAGGRMGIYFVEHGAAQRPSNVIYDRSHSVIAESGPECYDFDSMLSGCGHLHLTGITPSLSEKAYLTTLRLAEKAVEQGITISCDLNFRKKLWRCMEKIVAYADLIIGNEEDASDVFGIHAETAGKRRWFAGALHPRPSSALLPGEFRIQNWRYAVCRSLLRAGIKFAALYGSNGSGH